MPPRRGRPFVGAEPKDKRVVLRATATMVEQFTECARITGKTKTDLLEEMISRLYKDLTENKE